MIICLEVVKVSMVMVVTIRILSPSRTQVDELT